MMKKFCVFIFGVIFFLIPQATAHNKVVVIPLWSDSGDEIPTVTSAGQVWMDRNLGAARVAQSMDDYFAYGFLYQWGRLADGHEDRGSDTTATLSNGNVPGHDDFITATEYPYDWSSTQNDDLWQGVSGVNNPCPVGFRVPTETEWETERASWSSDDTAGAFASPLKFVAAGIRYTDERGVSEGGIHGNYWSSTVTGNRAQGLHIEGHSGSSGMGSKARALGYSVRCIKD